MSAKGHLKAQGQVEGFYKPMKKTAPIALAEGINLHEATYDMLQTILGDTSPSHRNCAI